MSKEFQILPSTRGVLYYIEGDGYYFYKQKVRRTKIYLKCHVDSCPVRAVAHISLKYAPTFSRLAHNHAPNPELAEVFRLRSRILTRCENETTSPRTIYCEEIANVNPNIALQLPFSSLCRTMYRRQKDFMDIADYIHANVTDGNEGEDESFEPENLMDITEIDVIDNTQEVHLSVDDAEGQKYLSKHLSKTGENLDLKSAKKCTNILPKIINKYEHFVINFKQLFFGSISNFKKNSVTCVVCREQTATVVCVPCGHLCLCDDCKLSYVQSSCPVCNESLSPFIKIL